MSFQLFLELHESLERAHRSNRKVVVVKLDHFSDLTCKFPAAAASPCTGDNSYGVVAGAAA
jgi:hypothetical protein